MLAKNRPRNFYKKIVPIFFAKNYKRREWYIRLYDAIGIGVRSRHSYKPTRDFRQKIK